MIRLARGDHADAVLVGEAGGMIAALRRDQLADGVLTVEGDGGAGFERNASGSADIHVLLLHCAR